MAALKVIALISGGKDSLYSLLHCLANGHEIVALANIHPVVPEDGSAAKEDIDSYMFQTVGHTVVPLFEEALGLPLYRRQTQGIAQHTDEPFSGHPERRDEDGVDEIEDLFNLIKEVKAHHPEATAVSAGAILSGYQRNRVERVARKLDLVPLSYLWQYPFLPPYSHTSLLHDMAAVGQDSRIIKTAHGGLDESLLWKNVAAPATILRLCKAMSIYDIEEPGAVLGEGGDFETLAIDGPSIIWKKRIEVDSSETTVDSGGAAYWTAKHARCVDKSESETDGLQNLRIPDLWDVEFKAILEKLLALDSDEPDLSTPNEQTQDKSSITSPPTPRGQILEEPNEQVPEALPVHLHADYRPPILISSHPPTPFVSNIAFEEVPNHYTDLKALKNQLWNINGSDDVKHDHIVHTTLLLRNMSDFATINKAYEHVFLEPLPPSRVTIACGDAMPKGVQMLMSVVVVQHGRRSKRKSGLHVQGRSYWAPANIGPYSQAIRVPDDLVNDTYTVYVAGQIPLVPASMDLYTEEGFTGQAVLALQHLWRIGRNQGVQRWTAGIAYLSSCPSPSAQSRATLCTRAWHLIHNPPLPPSPSSSSSDLDPWDALNTTPTPSFKDTISRPVLPDPTTILQSNTFITTPPIFAAQVCTLPRAASIEWHALGLALPTASLVLEHRRLACGARVWMAAVPAMRAVFWAMEICERGQGYEAQLRGWRNAVRGWGARGVRSVCAAVYAGDGVGGVWGEGVVGAMWVPCRRVWAEGEEVGGVVVGRVAVEGDGGGERAFDVVFGGEME